MIKRSTFSDLLSYSYNETDIHNSDRIQRALDGDPVLQEEYNELNELVNILDEAKPGVSPDSIKKILQFC